jgi:hypothetical protein
MSIFGSVLGGLAGLFTNRQTNRSNERIASNQLAANEALANRAMEEARFRPVNVSTSLGQTATQYDAQGRPTQMSANLDPRLLGLQGNALQYANQGFQQPVDINQLGQDYFNRYQAAQVAPRQQMFSQLQDRLAGQGLLGLNVNMPSGGAGNPFYSAFAEGIGRADAEAFDRSFMNADQLANSAQGRSINALNAALGVDKVGASMIDMAGVLGGRGSSAAASGISAAVPTVAAGQSAYTDMRYRGNDTQNAAIQQMIRALAPRIKLPTSGDQFGTGSEYGNQDYGQYF